VLSAKSRVSDDPPGGAMPTLQEKSAHLEEVKKRVEAYAASGGDLKSKDAVPLGIEFVTAFDAVAREFGYEILKQINRRQDFIRPDQGV
jgi:hypothetical protein